MKRTKKNEAMIFLPENISAQLTIGATVLELAERNGVKLNHSCGGMGSCGTCRVWIKSDLTPLPPRNEVEAQMAADRGFASEERLACQLLAFQGLCVQIPESTELPE